MGWALLLDQGKLDVLVPLPFECWQSRLPGSVAPPPWGSGLKAPLGGSRGSCSASATSLGPSAPTSAHAGKAGPAGSFVGRPGGGHAAELVPQLPAAPPQPPAPCPSASLQVITHRVPLLPSWLRVLFWKAGLCGVVPAPASSIYACLLQSEQLLPLQPLARL